MVVDDFHVAGVALQPQEADAILIIDPDAVMALALAVQRLQPVSGRHAQIIERHRGMHYCDTIVASSITILKRLQSPIPVQ
jgi:hypothetical protein